MKIKIKLRSGNSIEGTLVDRGEPMVENPMPRFVAGATIDPGLYLWLERADWIGDMVHGGSGVARVYWGEISEVKVLD